MSIQRTSILGPNHTFIPFPIEPIDKLPLTIVKTYDCEKEKWIYTTQALETWQFDNKTFRRYPEVVEAINKLELFVDENLNNPNSLVNPNATEYIMSIALSRLMNNEPTSPSMQPSSKDPSTWPLHETREVFSQYIIESIKNKTPSSIASSANDLSSSAVSPSSNRSPLFPKKG